MGPQDRAYAPLSQVLSSPKSGTVRYPGLAGRCRTRNGRLASGITGRTPRDSGFILLPNRPLRCMRLFVDTRAYSRLHGPNLIVYAAVRGASSNRNIIWPLACTVRTAMALPCTSVTTIRSRGQDFGVVTSMVSG